MVGIFACVASITACASPEPPPSLYDDATLAAQVADHDGFDGVAPLFQAWVHGREVFYWTIDSQTEQAMPVYRLCRGEGSRCEPINHAVVVDHLPGEDGYSPFGQIYEVRPSDGWDGQVTSVEELLAEVEAQGWPAPRATSEMMHCPIASLDAQVEVGADTTVGPTRSVYVRGLEARCFDFSASRPNRAVLPSGEMFVRHVYVLTREGETEPLMEQVRMTDLNGDGDMLDSNNIFGAALEDSDYTPLWKMVAVTVPADLASIDTTPAYTDATDMFDIAPDYTITPRTDRVLDYEITTNYINCPMQSAPGSL